MDRGHAGLERQAVPAQAFHANPVPGPACPTRPSRHSSTARTASTSSGSSVPSTRPTHSGVESGSGWGAGRRGRKVLKPPGRGRVGANEEALAAAAIRSRNRAGDSNGGGPARRRPRGPGTPRSGSRNRRSDRSSTRPCGARSPARSSWFRPRTGSQASCRSGRGAWPATARADEPRGSVAERTPATRDHAAGPPGSGRARAAPRVRQSPGSGRFLAVRRAR